MVDGVPMGADDEALGIMAAFAAALRDGVPLDDGRFLRDIDTDGLSRLLAPAPGEGALPMMEERVAGLRALGAAYLAHGGPLGLLALAGGDALGLVDVLATRCGWEDVRIWRGEPVVFRKRAQLCTAMIHGWSNGAAGLAGIDRLTVFADYRLPQVLRGVGVMSVSEPLARRIAAGGEYPMGAASVKELYDTDEVTIIGYAVALHTTAGTDGGNWYWYERVSLDSAVPHDANGVVADGAGDAGPAATICVSCHAAAGIDADHPGHDHVYTQVP